MLDLKDTAVFMYKAAIQLAIVDTTAAPALCIVFLLLMCSSLKYTDSQ